MGSSTPLIRKTDSCECACFPNRNTKKQERSCGNLEIVIQSRGKTSPSTEQETLHGRIFKPISLSRIEPDISGLGCRSRHLARRGRVLHHQHRFTALQRETADCMGRGGGLCAALRVTRISAVFDSPGRAAHGLFDARAE